MKNEIRIAAIQALPVSETFEDFGAGKEVPHAIELLEKASEKNIDIACFPELYPMVGEKELCEKAKELGIYVIAGLVENVEKGWYNTSTIISSEGKILGRQRKSFPTSLELEMYCIRWNQSYEVFKTEIGNIGIAICSDFSFFDVGVKQLLKKEVDILFNPSWWFAIGEAYPSTVIGRHLEFGIPVIGVDVAKFSLKSVVEDETIGFPAAGGYTTITIPPKVSNLQELSEWFKSMPGGSNSMNGFVWMLGEEEGILTGTVDIGAVRKFPGYFYTE
ncbi:MAG: carbon-nitrogen hydrolase family protein [Candidatus Methanofastidiosia archaeon]